MLKKLPNILLVTLLCLAGLVIGWQAVSQTGDGSYQRIDINPSQFFPEKFYPSLETGELPDWCQNEFTAGITSHHDLASPLIGQFFRCLAERNNPQTIIIIGPNHFQQGSRAILSGKNAWQTPFGRLAVDQDKLALLSQSELLEISDQAISRDHAVSFLAPYLKYFFPEAKMVPLLLRFDYTQPEAEQGIAWLDKIIDENTFLLGSIDFSHYLSLEQAEKNDKVSQQIIDKFYLPEIYRYQDDHYDSAPGLFTILSWLSEQGMTNAYQLNHGNSFDFNQKPFNTTSYFSWLFN